jgi:hypothetical protein
VGHGTRRQCHPRQLGHDADTVDSENLSGADDAVVLAAATSDSRALLTLDKGLADVRVYPPGNHGGVTLIRPKTTGPSAITQFAADHLPHLPNIDPRGRVIVVSPAGIRVR